MCLFCKLKLKFKTWLLFRKCRRVDYQNLVKVQKWFEDNPRSSSEV